jgi:hypothetical protein
MKKVLAGAGAMLVILAGLYVGSPWWATSRMRKAAEAGDGEKLATYVDYPALRADVKAQLTMSASSQKGLLAMIATHIVGAAADAMVTPENVAALVSTGRAQPLGAGALQFPEPPAEDEPPRVLRNKQYRSLDVFEVEMLDPETKKRLATLVFHREGLVGWKLSAIRFGEKPAREPAKP